MRKKRILAENVDLKCQINQLKSELTTLEKQLEDLAAERDKYKDLLEQSETKLNEQLSEANAFTEKIKALELELKSSKDYIAELEDQKQHFVKLADEQRAELQAARKKLEQNKLLIQQLGAEKEMMSVNIERLIARLQEEKKLNTSLKTEIEQLRKAHQPQNDIETKKASDENPKNLEFLNNFELLLPNRKHPAESSDPAMQAGAQIIGEIVVQAALISSRIASSRDPNAKELLTLALGRTEVFKSDILQQVHSDLSYEQKLENMNRLADETLEYFKSLEGQLSMQ